MSKDEGIPWELLKIEVPEGVPTETGYFEISGTATRETVNSRVYAWFLNREQNPVLAPLFCDALLHVARRKHDDTSIAERLLLGKYKCQLEVATSIGNRIDILLRDIQAQLAIIIENKIHAELRNDLRDYWNHVSYPEDQKLGILLTLHRTQVPENVKSRFINITHLEWIEAIESAGVPSGIPLYTYGMMTDFFNTIRNQSTNRAMNDQARFFFDHPVPVIQAKECLDAATNYIKGELREVAELLELSFSFPYYGYCYLKEKKHIDDAYYTIIFEQLLQSKDPILHVIIELYSAGIKHIDSLERALKLTPQSKAIMPSRERRGESRCVHFRTKTFLMNTDRISQLKDILIETIQEDFEPMMSIIHETLDGLIEKA